MCYIFCCSIIQGVRFNYHQRNVRSRVSISNFQVSVSAFLTKSRSRLEIWARSRSRRLRSRLHHCALHPFINFLMDVKSQCVLIYLSLSNLSELGNFRDAINKDSNARKCWKVWKQIHNYFPIKKTFKRSKIILNRFFNIPTMISAQNIIFSASWNTISLTGNSNVFLTISYFYKSNHRKERPFFIQISFWCSFD